METKKKWWVLLEEKPEEFKIEYNKLFDNRLHKSGNYKGVAKKILRDFLHTHGMVQTSIPSPIVEYLVDCIVEAAVLETVKRLEANGKLEISGGFW